MGLEGDSGVAGAKMRAMYETTVDPPSIALPFLGPTHA